MNIRSNIEKMLFYLFWTILISSKGFGFSSTNNEQYVYILGVAVVFAGLKLLFTNWTKKELLISLLLVLLGILILITTSNAGALLLIITITSLKNIDLNKLLKYTLILLSLLYFSRITLAIFGFLDMQMMVRYDSGTIHTIRYALGYDQPNVTQAIYFIIVSMFTILNKNKVKVWQYILIITFDYLIFRYTNSRSGFIICIVLVIISWLLSSKSIIIKKIILHLSTKCFYIGMIVSLLFCLYISYLSSKYSLGTFWSRFSTSINVFKLYSINLLGNKNVITDLGYIGTLYDKGIIFFMLFYVYLSKLLKKFKSINDIYAIACFICISIYMLLESYFDSILMNPLLIYFSIFIFSTTNKQISNKEIKGGGKVDESIIS